MDTTRISAAIRTRFAAGLALLAACFFLPVGAQAVRSEADLPALARQWLDQTLPLHAARAEQPLRLRATLGALDARLRLAPCARVEVYLPPGSRLWGASRVGLRCLEGATRWNVTMPVTVQALGSAWVLRRDVAQGDVLSAADLVAEEVDWAAEASPVLTGREAWAGQVAARPLRAGQTLRENLVRAEQVFRAGTQVRVLVQGGGFQISAQAQTLSAGVVGQSARVRMESGRVLTVTVIDARTVRAEI